MKDTLTASLMKLLTPKRRIDILRDVLESKENRKPYVITFCGVNGVGKSTNLAKVAFWLMQHGMKVMIAACDTFRSGAVEQLRTHAQRLGVELFERGYEKDPAAVARDALVKARQDGCDVLLVDTAGRMQVGRDARESEERTRPPAPLPPLRLRRRLTLTLTLRRPPLRRTTTP